MPMIPAFLFILAAVAYRVVTGLFIHSGSTWLSNFAPLAAIALCGAVYFPTRATSFRCLSSRFSFPIWCSIFITVRPCSIR